MGKRREEEPTAWPSAVSGLENWKPGQPLGAPASAVGSRRAPGLLYQDGLRLGC